MIRKPNAEDFRENPAVMAARHSVRAATDGVRATKRGVRKAYYGYIAATFGVGFLLTLVPHLLAEKASLVALLAMAGHVWHRRRALSTGQANYAAAIQNRARTDDGLPEGVVSRDDGRSAKLDPAALMVVAGALLVVATAVFMTRPLNPLPIASILTATAMILAGLLIAARLFRDPTVVTWDEHEIAVIGLIGRASLLWRDVGAIELHSFSPFDIGVLFTSGSRHNLVISARNRRVGSPGRLLLPAGLLALNEAGIEVLARRLVRCQQETAWSNPPSEVGFSRTPRRNPFGEEDQAVRRSLVGEASPNRRPFGRRVR